MGHFDGLLTFMKVYALKSGWQEWYRAKYLAEEK